MRIIDEIMEMVQTGQKPEYDELRLTVESLRNMLMLKFMDDKYRGIESFKKSIALTPEKYLGWDNNPDNPEYQARIKSSKRIAGNMIKLIERAEKSASGVIIDQLYGGKKARITFAEKPDHEIINALKEAGFTWCKCCWVGSPDNIPQVIKDMEVGE